MTAPLVLLDLDGTLTDSAPGIVASMAQALRELDLPVPAPAALRSIIGPPLPESLRAHGVPPERIGQVLATYRAIFSAGGMDDNSVFAGIPDALVQLREAGLTLAVATSKPEIYARPICDRFGLTGLVDGVYGAEGDEVRGSKAAVIARALGDLQGEPRGVPDRARIVMVGDREYDVLGAAVHSIRCLGALWGYGTADELVTAGAVGLVESPSGLATAVLQELGQAGQTAGAGRRPATRG